MVLGLVSSLLGLVFSLITLPFRLLGIPLAIFKIPLRIIVRLITRHTMLVLFLIVALFVYLHFKDSNERLPQLTPAQQTAKQARGGKMPLIEAVTKTEDGDSTFATDVYALMTPPEKQEYSRNYYWAMDAMPNGQTHQWQSYNIAGSLRPNDTFQNKSGVTCRHFNEVLKVHHIQQTISGTACKQATGAWCKLRPNATPACGLGNNNSGGWLGGLGRSFKSLF